MQFSLIPFISGLAPTVISLPLFIGLMRMRHEGQVTRDEGPKRHEKKSGILTMGGVILMLASAISTLQVLIWQKNLNKITRIPIIAFLDYRITGFLDDGIKLYFKRNLGLKAWQKLLGQTTITVLIIVLTFSDHLVFELYIPFAGMIKNSFLFSLFVLFWLVGPSNAVNLSDGLDGLTTGLSIIAYAIYAWIVYQEKNWVTVAFTLGVIGGLVGFFISNHKPAKILMGDAGSLALGGGLATVSIFLHRPWSLFLIGIVFVLETLGIILQTISFQTTEKRIFKMTPIHHHFEMPGWSEWKVDIVFWTVGLIGGIIYLIIWG